MKVYIETLGCPKNVNDSQMAAGILEKHGNEIVSSPEAANCIMVNTCGFINDAKKESIDKIFQMANLKHDDVKLIVSGCLSQRYGEELYEEMPEVDCFIGVNEYEQLPEIIEGLFEKEERILKNGPCSAEHLERTIRKYEDNPYTATIKIAEGCDNRCAYCSIPFIRGKYRSKSIEDIILEAKELADLGCKELILIAQDLTYYGKDLYGKYSLVELLEELCKVDGIQWIRLMYAYEDKIDDRLIDLMAREEKICKYIDIPLQHCNDKVLKEMNRNTSKKQILSVIEKLRKKMPDIHIRTTLIVGFPGETDEEYDELVDFVENMKFDRLGVFPYSQEENTKAGIREDQIEEEIKQLRLDGIMRRQIDISLKKNQEKIGSILEVLVDGEEEGSYIGRSRYDAPEIDNEVIFTSTKVLQPGDLVKVKIVDAFDYDLVGEAIYE